jgi:hydroxyacylglutathione hydrolase
MLKYQTVPVTAFEQNCSVLWCAETLDAAVIDPGGNLERIVAVISAHGLTMKAIWLTHAHIDHAGGTAAFARDHRLPIIGPHMGDRFWIDGLPQQGAMFGFPPSESFTPTRWLQDNDRVTLGRCELEVRHCPGHTPGHVVFVDPVSRRAFVGDVLFAGSIGRTDFPGGDHATLIASITQKLWPYGDDMIFIPGHGPESNFGQERRHNPFVCNA